MFDALCKLLEAPLPYQETAAAFWDDEYISKQMLKAHLDPECDGASRKLPFIQKSAAWIKEAVPPASYPRLLDIGCGPGLYAEQFARAGFQVTGVDFSRRSIQYAQASARQKNLEITYLYRNYQMLHLVEKFDLATMIYCDYGVLPDESRKRLLQTIQEHLEPGGKFLLDVFSMEHYNRFQEKKTWQFHNRGGFWREAEHLELCGCCRYPNGVTLEQVAVVTENESTVYYLWNTCYTVESLKKEMQEAGFQVCGVFGDVSGSGLEKNSLTIAMLLEKPYAGTCGNM